MKRQKISETMGKIDSRHLKEAANYVPGTIAKINFIKLAAIAACLCAVLAMSVIGIAFWKENDKKNSKNSLPDQPSKEDTHPDSEYQGVIKVLGEYYDYVDSLPPSDDTGVEPLPDISNQSYVEVTDNQEQGVIEGDLLKRSDRYAYYLVVNGQYSNNLTVNIYSIEGSDSQKAAQFNIEIKTFGITDEQLYLSADCKTLTVVFNSHQQGNTRSTYIYSYDVSDLSAITQKGYFSVKGSLIETRKVGNDLVLVNSFSVNRSTDYSNPKEYIPCYDDGNGEVLLKPDEIYYPETISSSSYLVFTTLDANTLTLKGTMALLSYTEKMYFTDDTVYTSYKKTSSENGVQTVLSALQYRGKDGLKLLGSATVNGTIHNQYSMDEYNGILRVVTSANSSADLYCISLDDYTVKAQVIGFAPKWETVRSVRFDGDYAYVCTAVQMSDPVFFFDLSDLSNITYKHTGDIPGFSHSLVDFGDGYLLGIGQNEDQYGKIEIYKESENGVEIVCNKTLVGFISNEYKAFFIDRQNKRVGFCYTEVENKSSIPFSPKYSYTYRYMLLEFNQNRLIVLIDSVLEESKEFSEKHNVRAFCDDNRIFVFDTEFFDTYAVVSPSEGESSLEFWIGDIVDDIDFSQYEINDNYHLSKVYYGKSYSSEDSSNCVLYTISQYPNSQSSKLYISNIRITDPSVKLWGLTMNSTNEKFAATMMAKGFDVKKEGGGGWYIATNDHYTVTFTKNGKYIEISIRLEQSEK